MNLRIIFCMSLISSQGFAQPNKERFLSEYSRAESQAAAYLARNMSATLIGTSYDHTGRITDTIRCEYAAGEDSMLATLFLNPETAADPAGYYIHRPEGFYTVVPSSKTNQFILKRSQAGKLRTAELGVPCAASMLPFTRFGQSVQNLLSASDVTFVTDDIVDGYRQVKVLQTFGDGRARSTYKFHREDLFLDSFRSGPASGADTVEAKFQYTTIGDKKVLVTVEKYLISPDGKSHLSSRNEYRNFQEAHFPRSHFSLARFDLPEPQGVSWERPTTRYYYFALTGILFATLAVLCRWLAARRRNRPQSAATPA